MKKRCPEFVSRKKEGIVQVQGHLHTNGSPFVADAAVLSTRDFNRLADFIGAKCGIKLPIQKKIMVEGRLRKRLRALGLTSFTEYCDLLFESEATGEELVHMIDAITTNKTDFFREPKHFELLTERIFPELLSRPGVGTQRPVKAWSAGCSTGEEPYSLAISMAEYAAGSGRGPLCFEILATDISTRVLEIARKAVYDEGRVADIPLPLRSKYLLRSKDRTNRVVRIAPEIRARVQFQRLNLMETGSGLKEPMDLIFCRNVLIYFNRSTQAELVEGFRRSLRPGGFLFLGHSETLAGFDHGFQTVAPTVYRSLSAV